MTKLKIQIKYNGKIMFLDKYIITLNIYFQINNEIILHIN